MYVTCMLLQVEEQYETKNIFFVIL